MTATEKAGSRSRGPAPRSGVKKTVKFRGATLTLPAKVPFRVMLHMSSGERLTGPELIAALTDILGEAQMETIWAIDIPMNGQGMHQALADVLDELVDKVFGAYGVTAGE